MYHLNDLVTVIQRNENIILCNQENGKFLKITVDAWGVIQDFLSSECTLEAYLLKYEVLNEKKFINDFLVGLIDRKILLKQETIKRDILLYWDITNKCNLRCIHCCANAGEGVKENISLNDCLNIARCIMAAKPSRIIISGGEPLVHPYFKEIITYLKANNNKMTLMTNGTLIDLEMAKFIKKHFDIVEVSVDGINEETCSAIRGEGVFDKTIFGIKMLKKVGIEKISASMLLTDKTIKLTEIFKKICEDNGIYPVIRELIVAGRAKDNLNKLNLDKKEENSLKAKRWLLEEAFSKKKIPNSCGAAISKYQIDRFGNIYPCQLLDSEEFLLGNLKNIEDIELFFDKRLFKETNGYKNYIKYQKPQEEKCKNCEWISFCSSCAAENYLGHHINDCECMVCKELYNKYFD